MNGVRLTIPQFFTQNSFGQEFRASSQQLPDLPSPIEHKDDAPTQSVEIDIFNDAEEHGEYFPYIERELAGAMALQIILAKVERHIWEQRVIKKLPEYLTSHVLAQIPLYMSYDCLTHEDLNMGDEEIAAREDLEPKPMKPDSWIRNLVNKKPAQSIVTDNSLNSFSQISIGGERMKMSKAAENILRAGSSKLRSPSKVADKDGNSAVSDPFKPLNKYTKAELHQLVKWEPIEVDPVPVNTYARQDDAIDQIEKKFRQGMFEKDRTHQQSQVNKNQLNKKTHGKVAPLLTYTYSGNVLPILQTDTQDVISPIVVIPGLSIVPQDANKQVKEAPTDKVGFFKVKGTGNTYRNYVKRIFKESVNKADKPNESKVGAVNGLEVGWKVADIVGGVRVQIENRMVRVGLGSDSVERGKISRRQYNVRVKVSKDRNKARMRTYSLEPSEHLSEVIKEIEEEPKFDRYEENAQLGELKRMLIGNLREGAVKPQAKESGEEKKKAVRFVESEGERLMVEREAIANIVKGAQKVITVGGQTSGHGPSASFRILRSRSASAGKREDKHRERRGKR